MGNGGSKKGPSVEMDSATALEEQWMDPHKRKVLAAVEDTIKKCTSDHNTPEILRSIRVLCAVVYCANDFELIQKSKDTFNALVHLLQNPEASYPLRLEIVSAVSVLCQGNQSNLLFNQVNCRSWCAVGGVTALLAQLREIPSDGVDEPKHRAALQMNVWVVYTLRTLMCGSPGAIQAVLLNRQFKRTAEMLVKMFELKDVWQRTAEQRNYALDCCVLLGIGGVRKGPTLTVDRS
ncbi:hypothetical protein BV898_17996 [Hypsibius exemplaris]|uniref:Uncharacterized protein n=1 Tax=Hypsibius exemplaris TaxID=2072580 RepID=A0A9X6NJ86_HYPEX|nr:hypothetical protein BV898_17996 [Hypsibius exemplaris]